jgi:hypothetical protein
VLQIAIHDNRSFAGKRISPGTLYHRPSFCKTTPTSAAMTRPSIKPGKKLQRSESASAIQSM